MRRWPLVLKRCTNAIVMLAFALDATAHAEPDHTPKRTAPASEKTNVNTASEAELLALFDSLSPGRSSSSRPKAKAIIAERGKRLFKDWDDFDHRLARTSVNSSYRAKIKNLVSF